MGGASRERISLVDIGCNIGTFTVLAAALGFEVLGVDALDENLKRLDTSLRVNQLTSRVTLVHNGLSNKREKLAVYNCKRCGPGSTHISSYDAFERRDLFVNNTQNHKLNVAWAVLLDDLIPLVRTRHVLMKIDVESTEGLVLRGAERFFQEVDVVGIMMEWEWVRHKKQDADFIIRFLSGHGFLPHPSPSNTTRLPLDTPMKWTRNIYWSKT